MLRASALSLLIAMRTFAAEPQLLELTGDLNVHDPVMIKQGDTYYLFSTGGGREGQGVIPIRTSKDMRDWRLAGYALEKLPEWATAEIPKARNAWAPDISLVNGRYHLYYSVSTFGSMSSAIGLATNVTLDAASVDYKWVDEGMVVRSRPESTDWNAIDPNLVVDDESNLWLAWGSFWGGIQLHRLNAKTGKFGAEDTRFYALASRERARPVNGSVEAPFITKREGGTTSGCRMTFAAAGRRVTTRW